MITTEHAKEIIVEILKAFEIPMLIQQQDIDVSISIGTALIEDDPIQDVRHSMLKAKSKGRRRADFSNLD